jgi:hypothetical protein
MKKQTGRIEAAFSKHSTYLRRARPLALNVEELLDSLIG